MRSRLHVPLAGIADSADLFTVARGAAGMVTVLVASGFRHDQFFWCMFLLFILYFFFFQAEDGIRDVAVTGVQTCALPISVAAVAAAATRSARPLRPRLRPRRSRRAPRRPPSRSRPSSSGFGRPPPTRPSDRKSVV